MLAVTSRSRWFSVLFLLLLGCQRGEKSEAREEKPAAGESALVVFAATSLRDAFTLLRDDFRRAHPGTDVLLNFAGTQELRVQLEHGAPADVFASADQRHMRALSAAHRVFTPRVFARNETVLVVSSRASTTISGLVDLPAASRLVLGAREVPIGQYSLELLDKASLMLGDDFRSRVEAKVVSRELNVRQVLAKVALGEADAGIVYRSDVHAPPEGVRVVAVPPALTVFAEYPIAVVQRSPREPLANAWVSLVLSAEGRARLGASGFLPPESEAAP